METPDFLPERIRSQRARRRRLVRQGYLLAACAAGLTLLGFFRQSRIAEAQGELVLLQGRVEGMKSRLQIRTDLEKQLADLMVKRRIDETLGSRVTTLDVLAELDRVLPESMALTDLTVEGVEVRVPVEPAGVPAAGRASPKLKDRTVKRVRLLIAGLAPTDVDVASFIGQLSASPLFEDVNMGYVKTLSFRGRAARQFQASCYVVP